MESRFENLQLFCSNLKISLDPGTPVQGGIQYKLHQHGFTVYLTLYNNGNCYPRGVQSPLLDLVRVWCDKTFLDGMLRPDFAASWREWNTNASEVLEYHKVNGIPEESSISDDYKINREITFHDFMFSSNRGDFISIDSIQFVVRNWFKRFCFMNISADMVLDKAFQYLSDNQPLGFNGTHVPFSFAAEMISVSFVGFCFNKSLSCKGGKCPFNSGDDYECLADLVDLMYMYSEHPRVISYNKTNLNKIIKGKVSEVSWISIDPSTPIEETMRNALFDAGILSMPQYQALAPTRKFRVDYMIPTPNGGMLAVECDGLQYHAKPSNYISDRRRDNLLLEHGIIPVRFSSVDIQEDINGCIDTIESLFRSFQLGNRVYHRNGSISYFNSNE